MAIEAIQEKILHDARQEADKIKEEATREAADILKRSRTRIDTINTKGIRMIQKEVEEHKTRFLAMERLESRKGVLKEKQRLIDEVFQKAQSSIMAMGKEDFQRLIKGILLKVVEKGDEEVIFAPSTQSNLDDNFLDGVNTELNRIGKKGMLNTLSSTNCKPSSGFILKKERMEINCSIEAIINAIRDDLEQDIAKVLFGE